MLNIILYYPNDYRHSMCDSLRQAAKHQVSNHWCFYSYHYSLYYSKRNKSNSKFQSKIDIKHVFLFSVELFGMTT